MPSFTGRELRNAIAERKIQAISIDTNIFDQFGCNLKIPTLRKLDQFRDTDISVVFSEIVVREVKKHINRASEKARSDLDASLSKCKERWHLNFDFDQVFQAIGINKNDSNVAERQFNEFGRHVEAIIIPVNGHVDIDELNKRYFDTKAPFESNAKKKAEFPDAMALLSLESWAKQRGVYILLVSNDKGWQKFSELSNNLICVENLEFALDHFNEAVRFIANEIVLMLQDGEAKALSDEISAAIQSYLDENNFSIDADSNFWFEKEYGEAVLQRWQVSKSTQPRIIAYDKETITFALDMECVIDFTADIDVYLGNYEEGDYTHMGSETISKKDDIQISSVLTISRELSPEPKLVEANITTQEIEANFGKIEIRIEPESAWI